MLPPKPVKQPTAKVVPLRPSSRSEKVRQNLQFAPPELRPIGFGSLMPPYQDNGFRERAWCVATFDAESGKLLRANIYSSPARGLTQNLRTETLLEGPVGMGRSFQEARDAVVGVLKSQPNYRWLWRAVRDYEQKTGIDKLKPGTRL